MLFLNQQPAGSVKNIFLIVYIFGNLNSKKKVIKKCITLN